jgi:hypothetical protein
LGAPLNGQFSPSISENQTPRYGWEQKKSSILLVNRCLQVNHSHEPIIRPTLPLFSLDIRDKGIIDFVYHIKLLFS